MDDLQDQYATMDTEADVEKLRKILEGHMLRRMKADVDLEIPDKQELIVRVELSKSQKDLYRAVLTRNYEVLHNEGGRPFHRSVALSPCRPVALSPCRPAALSPCRPVALSPYHPAVPPSRRPTAPPPHRPVGAQ